MFSTEEKQKIAAAVEKVLLSFNHPEMPKEKPDFKLHVDGAEDWSWADIIPNHLHTKMEENSFLQINETCKLCGTIGVCHKMLAHHRLGKCVLKGVSE